MRTDRLYIFTHECNASDAKTPKELYDAIEELGPLPRYHTFVDGKGKEEHLTEPAIEEAKAVYAHARQIAIWIRKSNQNLTPLPPTETDPFLGLQTIQDWCVAQGKPGIWGLIWLVIRKSWKFVVVMVGFLSALFACIHYWPEIQQKLQSLFSH